MNNLYARTVFFVDDGERSLAFYTGRLGFNVDWKFDSDGRAWVFQVSLFGFEIEPVKVGFAAFYESLNRVDLTENHPDEKPYAISGTKVREMLVAGERPPEKIMRGGTADVLIEAYRKA